jgi:hypothetical protein
MKKVLTLALLVMFAISMVAQTAAPAAPKTDDKTCACCADKAKCEDCCKNDCKDCGGMKDGKMADCCKGKGGKMACARDKDGKMACCKGMHDMKDMKDGKMSKKGCCGGMCDRKAHEKKAGM